MNRKNILIIVLIFIFAAVAGYFFVRFFYGNDDLVSLKINDRVFKTEIVSDKDAMAKGLGGKDSICSQCAMLFQFEIPGKYAFWMKDMKFPIDIIWINDSKIVFIEKNVSPSKMDTMIPSQEADQVLEINGGKVDKFDIKIGDEVQFK